MKNKRNEKKPAIPISAQCLAGKIKTTFELKGKQAPKELNSLVQGRETTEHTF